MGLSTLISKSNFAKLLTFSPWGIVPSHGRWSKGRLLRVCGRPSPWPTSHEATINIIKQLHWVHHMTHTLLALPGAQPSLKSISVNSHLVKVNLPKVPNPFIYAFKWVPGKSSGIVGQDPSDSKSNRLHVDIFRLCFHSFEVYFSIDSSKTIGNTPEVSNFNRWLFLKLNRFICN
jgi:hypothetical protein